MSIKRVLLSVAGCAALFAQAAETEITDNVEIPAEGLTIDVASGDTTTYSGVLSGTGKITKTGEGTLVLSGANTFSGGLSWAKGVVRVDREGALGTGTVDVQTGAGGLVFNAPGATFSNYIHKYDGSTLFMTFKADTTLTGTVKHDYNCDPEVRVDSGVTVTFEGAVDGRHNNSRGLQLNAIGGGTLIFKGAFTASCLHDWGNGKNNAGSTVEFWSASNIFYGSGSGGGSLEFGGINYICRAANVLNRAVLNRSRNRSYTSELDLDGNDQEVWGFSYNSSDTAWSDAVGGTITTPVEKPATLTVKGSGTSKTDSCNFEINGAVSLVLDADPTYTLNCIHRISKTTGSITVKSGTFKIGGSSTSFKKVPSVTVEEGASFSLESGIASGALAGLTTLTVGKDATFTVGSSAPFTADQVTVRADPDATLDLSSSVELKVVDFYIGEERQTAGEYTSANCPVIKSGKIVVPGKTVAAGWTGAGADEKVTTKENWSAESAFDFAGDQLTGTFADAGTRAVFDTAVKFTGLTLTAPNFTFDAVDEGRMSVGEGGILAAAIGGDDPRRFAFNAPLSLSGDQTWTIPEGTTFAIVGLDSTATVKITKDGTGALELTGTNSFSGSLRVPNGATVISGLVTTPNGIVDVDPTKEIDKTDCLNFGGNGQKTLRLQGATIDMPLVWGHKEENYGDLRIAANTTNYLRSAFCNSNLSSQGFFLETNSVLVSSGGVQQITPWYIEGYGTWIIREKPIYWYSSNTGKELVLNAAGDADPHRVTLRFETTGNLHNFRVTEYGGTIDCRVNDAFNHKSRLNMNARWNGYSYLELHSTTQTFLSATLTFTGLASDYAYGRSEVHGDAGAALGVCGSENSLFDLPIVGNVSILKSGTGMLAISNRVYASTGDIVVSDGTLKFAENADPSLNATWMNGTNVVVKGTGRLELPPTPVFNRKFARLHLADDGVIAIPSGTTAKFKTGTLDDADLQPGVYTYASAPDALKKHLTSDGGDLVIRGEGLLMIVR